MTSALTTRKHFSDLVDIVKTDGVQAAFKHDVTVTANRWRKAIATALTSLCFYKPTAEPAYQAQVMQCDDDPLASYDPLRQELLAMSIHEVYATVTEGPDEFNDGLLDYWRDSHASA